jgi:hypothetical protein
VSRVAQPASATPPPVLYGKTAIFRAIRPGTRRCCDQREWLRTVLDAIEAEPWYANRRVHYAAIARQLMRHMHWRERTTRPGHERIAVAVGVSPDTVARAVAWMRDRGLLGLVSPGSTPLLRPYALHGDEGNLAVVYICTVPRKRAQQLPPLEAGHGSFADLTRSRSDRVSVPRAHEAKPQPEKARATRGQPMLPRPSDGNLNTHPQTRSERLTAARAMQDRFRMLRRLSDRHVRHLARPFTLAGWTPADVLFAIDHEPGGRQHGYTAEIRFPAAWMASRLTLWLDPATGIPLPSRSQLVAEQRHLALAGQAKRRKQAEARRDGAGDYARQAARARQMLTATLAKSRDTATVPRSSTETA